MQDRLAYNWPSQDHLGAITSNSVLIMHADHDLPIKV